jgi:23S rRNA G2445 N2-methylase RlmL
MSEQAKEQYRQLRQLPWAKLWQEEVPRFNRATPKERLENAAVVRAVAVVFAETGAVREKEAVRNWLLDLLKDPGEKIRRYAVAALPKIGAGVREEGALLTLLDRATSPGEKEFVLEALEKIGGAATLEALRRGNREPGLEQKLKAGTARQLSPSAVRMDRVLVDFKNAVLHLRSRPGLESFVGAEVAESAATGGMFRVESIARGLVVAAALGPFSLADIYHWRCFGTVGFILGRATVKGADSTETLAQIIASPLSRRFLRIFTEGIIRYRLDFVGRGHQRAAVRLLAERVYALCPEILNDARNVTWTMEVYQESENISVELCPNLTPDPRIRYRLGDVPAASHPPLAACMARLAGRMENEMVWDPFCGSGLELIERALLGGVRRIIGTDLSQHAIDVARKNFGAAKLDGVQADFICGDFRHAVGNSIEPGSATLIITNPPMGIRVPVADRRSLMNDLFSTAAKALRPGGRFVVVNPLHLEKAPLGLERQFREEVEMGGFSCRLEKYLKRAR